MYEELKKLAESAPEGPWLGPEYAPGTSYVFDVDLGTLLHYESIDTEKDACLRYVAAANPSAVLALIADLVKIYADRKACWAEFKVQGRYIDRLKAENEALRNEVRMLSHEIGGTSTHPSKGHGHVFPRADGVRMRCGGPAMCKVCQGELAIKDAKP